MSYQPPAAADGSGACFSSPFVSPLRLISPSRTRLRGATFGCDARHSPACSVTPFRLPCCCLQNYSADLLCSALAAAGLQPEELLRVNDPQRPPYTVSGGFVEAGSRLDSGSSLKFHNGHKKPATASGHVRTVLSLSCAALYWTVLAAAGQGGCTAILPVRCHQPLVPAAGGRLAAPRSRLHVRRRRQATAGNITLLGSWS